MNPLILYPAELVPFLLEVGLTRAVFIWGAPGIGKSDLVKQFAEAVGMECVSILGSQLAPEDLMGVPRIEDGFTKFFPPSLIAREEPYVLFLDELNACTPDVQKSFYSLILDHRIGEYSMPKGSVVIAAGNRAQDGAIVRTLPTPLVNRMFQVHLEPRLKDWMTWAHDANIHPWVIGFLEERPNALHSAPSKDQTPFSTPRSWHMLSDALRSLDVTEEMDDAKKRLFDAAVYGTLSLDHANQFRVFVKRQDRRHYVHQMLKGKASWPTGPEEQDWLVFLVDSFRDVLIKELPEQAGDASSEVKQMAYAAKGLIGELASRNEELARLLLTQSSAGHELPNWFLAEVVRALPALAVKREKNNSK
jgi:hypothetical protein